MSESPARRVATREKKRRLFFALWPGEAQRAAIEEAMRRRVETSRGRAVPPENLHVTLVFIGGVAESRFEHVIECATRVRGTRFELILDQLEVWGRARVLCLTASRMPSALLRLEEQLRFNLLNDEFDVRQEEYRPHVTLARDVRRRNARESIAPIAWPAEEFVLVESHPTPSGSEYRLVERWKLQGSGS